MPFFEITPLAKMSKTKKILEDVHPLDIIREVRKVPALYVRDCPERASPHYRNKLWTEVAKAVMPEWDTYSNTQKYNKVTDLIKRWRNLRDTFRRQLEVEKKIREGHEIKKKPYVYFKHMSFLLPHVTSGEEETLPPPPPPPPKRARRRRPDPAPTHSRAGDDIDEDHHFLMSLVPSFRRMTDDEKLTAKMEILKVIRNVRDRSHYETDALAGATDDVGNIIKQEMFVDIEPEDEVSFIGNDSGDDDDGDDNDTD